MQYENIEESVEAINNNVMLCGTITEVNQTEEDRTYDILLSVNRLSGMADRIPVILTEELKTNSFYAGQTVTVRGIFTSTNKIIGDRSKLILTVFASEIAESAPAETDNPNMIELVGYICKAPIYRTTPFNREIADLLLAVNRSFNKSDYIPAIAWGKNARFAKNLLVGEKVQLNGRIQSREYQKRLDDGSVEVRTAYEVSINALARVEG